MNVTGPPQQQGPALSCMDYGHHDPVHSHRVCRFQAVERPPQSLCDDDGKPGDDDGNPYTVMLSEAKHLAADRDRPFPFAEFTLERSEGLRASADALRVTGCDCANYQGRFFTIEPCHRCVSYFCFKRGEGQSKPIHCSLRHACLVSLARFVLA